MALKKASLFMMPWRWAVTGDARSDHHWQPHPYRQLSTWWMPPPRLYLLMCSRSNSSQMVCRATFNSSVIVGFDWSLFYFSSMTLHNYVIVQGVQIWRVSMISGQFVCSHFCMTNGTLRNWEYSLRWKSIILSIYGYKVLKMVRFFWSTQCITVQKLCVCVRVRVCVCVLIMVAQIVTTIPTEW